MAFQQAKLLKAKLRVALAGPSKSGKTYTGLAMGFGITKEVGGKLGVICAEKGSAAKYVDLFPPFDINVLKSYHPQRYIEAIDEAERAGFSVLLIDGISQCWAGKDGVLEIKDKASQASRSGNDYTAWRSASPLHNQFVERMLDSNLHLIVTMRAKTSYAMEPGPNGKLKVVKLGLSPVQRDGIEYEFDIFGEMNQDHIVQIEGSRCYLLDHVAINPSPIRPDGKPCPDNAMELGRVAVKWAENGEVDTVPFLTQLEPTIDPEALITAEQKKMVHVFFGQIFPKDESGKIVVSEELKKKIYAKFSVTSSTELNQKQARELLGILQSMKSLVDLGQDPLIALD